MPKAVSVGTPAESKNAPIVREFTDREEPRQRFWEKYDAMEDGSWEILSFYGTAGIGKTELLEKLMQEMVERNKALGDSRYKFVRCDFSNMNNKTWDVVNILNWMEEQLESEGIDFPLYATGEFYYTTLMGGKADPPELKTSVDKNPTLSKIKKALNSIDGKEDTLTSGMNTAISLLDIGGSMAQVAASAVPVLSVVKSVFGVAEKVAGYIEAKRRTLDSAHAVIQREMQERLAEGKHPERIYDYLPALFARDINDWVDEHHAKLVIFLDGYERFGVEEWDLWLRSGNKNSLGMINNIPNVFWVIAGRNKLQWDGVPGDELKDPKNQLELMPLSYEDANSFLTKAGITNQELCDGIIKLTGGWPLYLNGCVDIYAERGEKTVLSDFGKKREDVFKKIVENLGTETREMIRGLCALKTWTDEMAYEVLKPNFNPAVYEQVKTLSFLHDERIEDNGVALTVFEFDRTVHEILFSQYKQESTTKYLYSDICDKICHYSIKKMKNAVPNSLEFIYYLRACSDSIVRLAKDTGELRSKYEDYVYHMLKLLNWRNRRTKNEIIETFMNRVVELGETDSVSYAFFELQFSRCKSELDESNKAYEHARNAYEIFRRILSDKHQDTLTALHAFANATKRIGKHRDAAELFEKALRGYQELYDKNCPEALSIMEEFSECLHDLDMLDEELKIHKERLTAYKQIYGENNIELLPIMNEMIFLLGELDLKDELKNKQDEMLDVGKTILLQYRNLSFDSDDTKIRASISSMNTVLNYEDALQDSREWHQLKEEILSAYRNTINDDDPILIDILEELSLEYETNERMDDAIKARREIISICQRNYGEKDERTIEKMEDLAYCLQDEFPEKAVTIWKQIIDIRMEDVNEPKENKEINEKRIKALNALADAYEEMGREEELDVRKKVLGICRQSFDETDEQVFHAIEKVYCSLASMEKYDEVLSLKREQLTLCKKKYGESAEETLKVMDEIAFAFGELNRDDEELKIRRDIVALCSKTKKIQAMEELSYKLREMERYEEALAVAKEKWDICKEEKGMDDDDTLDSMDSVREILASAGRVAEEISMWQQIIYLRQNRHGAEAEDTIWYMDDFVSRMVELQKYDSALEMQERIWCLRKENYGETHPETVAAEHKIVQLLCFSEKYRDAISMQKEAVKLYRKSAKLGVVHKAITILYMCIMLGTLKKYDEDWSEELQEEVMDLFNGSIGSEKAAPTLKVIKLIKKWSTAEMEEKRDKEAKECLGYAVELSKAVFGEDDKHTKELASAYANA